MCREMVDWESKDVFNPAAVMRDDKVYLLYRAEDTAGCCTDSKIAVARCTEWRT